MIGGNHLGGRALQFLYVEKYLGCPQGSYYSILYGYRVTLSFSHKAEEQIVFFKDPTACACACQRNFDLQGYLCGGVVVQIKQKLKDIFSLLIFSQGLLLRPLNPLC